MDEKFEAQLEQLKNKKFKEAYDRITAVQHINVEYFREHKKIEGYYEDRDVGHLFGCDRLMKIDTMFGRLQLGYNPNRGRSFIFANLKTSRYDTVSSRYQRELKEYQMHSLLKGQNQNRAYTAKHRSMSSVLLEKSEAVPWTEASVKPYYKRVGLEALQKTMPFFAKQEEEAELLTAHRKQKEWKDTVAQNSRESKHEENVDIYRQQREMAVKEEMLVSLIERKEAMSKHFLRKVNYVYDLQKHEMFAYYKNKRNKIEQSLETNMSDTVDEDDENTNNNN